MLPTEIYPTEIRGTGHGLASGTAKFGAFLGTICLPKVQMIIGIHTTVFALSLTLLIGYFLTNLLDQKQIDSVEQFELKQTDVVLHQNPN